MKTTLLQLDIDWNAPETNLPKAQEAILAAEKSDLYVLPEMFATGFVTQPEGKDLSSDTILQWMKQTAILTDAAICGSVAVKEGDCYRNRLYFVKPDGHVTQYDKRHLFAYGGEDRHYLPGNERVVVEWRGVRFLLLVCYDLRFPLWTRNAPIPGDTLPAPTDGYGLYDAIIYVASWPTPRQLAWETLLRARAIENQCYVLGVNRCGTDPTCHYTGGTILINAYGQTVSEAAPCTPCTVTGTIDMQWLNRFRDKFPVLADGDSL